MRRLVRRALLGKVQLGFDLCSMQSAIFSTPEMRRMEASARLKPALCTPWLGAARAPMSCLQVMHYASGNLAYFYHL